MSGHTSQEVCPWNVKFSRDATEAGFEAREVIAGKDARTLAAEVLAMSQEEFSAAFRKSPIKRAKRGRLQSNARAVPEHISESSDPCGASARRSYREVAGVPIYTSI